MKGVMVVYRAGSELADLTRSDKRALTLESSGTIAKETTKRQNDGGGEKLWFLNDGK